MTRFEQLKARKCTEIRLSLDYQKALLDKWENISIEEMVNENIRQTSDNEYIFVFSQVPYQYVSMENKESVAAIAQIYFSQEVDNNG